MDATISEKCKIVNDEEAPSRKGFQVRLPAGLAEKVDQAVAEYGVSRNAWFVMLARAAVGMNAKQKETT